MPEDDLLTLGEAAQELGVAPAVLAALLDRGALASVPGAGLLRLVRRGDLDSHREARFALRQSLAAQARLRRTVRPPEIVPGVPSEQAWLRSR